MCGIAGFISHQYTKEHLQKMTNCIDHRGPNAEGFYIEEESGIFLGHRRLSILDLSTTANQPMKSHCGKYVMIYNGELYNFNEIKKTKFTNIKWNTTSDSEVILECFIKYGTECFTWFNGMFALAIWDTTKKELIIARDQIGIKPLFIYKDENVFAFASEIKAIKTLVSNLQINKSVIPLFLHLGYIPHPHTIYQGVQKFSAGSFAIFSNNQLNQLNQLKLQKYWSIEKNIEPNVLKNESVAKNKLNTILINAVKNQLISDVPIGTFLSGGTDSSIVTAIATKVSNSKIKTFSIAVTDGKINEAPFAAATAKYLDTEHYEMPITQKEIMEMVPTLLNVYDEPFSDASAFPTLMVSKLASQYVKVALSGDGGDELFLGYGSYNWAKKLNNPVLKTLKAPINLSSKIFSDKYKRVGKLFQAHPSTNFKSHLFSQDQSFFSEIELNDLLVNIPFNFSTINYHFNTRLLNQYEAQSFWDIENYLKDDLLVKVDRAGMQYALETRVPLLDIDLVTFALNLDTNLKIKNGTAKYLLKQVLYNYVPKTIMERPKWGFSIPLAKWLKTDLKWMIDKYCNTTICQKYNLLNASIVSTIVKKYLAGQNHLCNRVWCIIILHWFLDEQEKK